MKSVSVVIPNYNGKSLLEENLPTVFLALKKLENSDFEVVVADDASTDDSVSFLRAVYPQVVLIENRKNLGFSGNINSGLKAASKDLILALNSDVKLDENYFLDQMKYFAQQDVFGVMGTIMDPRNSKITDTAKYPVQTLFGVIQSTLNATNEEKGLPTFFLSGANALMDRKKLSQIGYFNEIFSPFYGEDVDLGMRAWRMGWKSYYEPKSICYHEISSTILSSHKKKTVKKISRRNKFVFHDLHLTSVKRFLFFSKLALDLMIRWIAFDFGFYSSFFEYLKRKKSISAYKKSFEELNPKLSAQEALLLIQKEMRKSSLKFLNQ